MRRCVAVLLFVAALLAPAAAAHAEPGKAGNGVSIGVGTPAEPLTGKPGEVVSTWISLSNSSDRAVDITIVPVRLRPDDDGKLKIEEGEDPRWRGAVQLPGPLQLAPQSNQRVPVTVTVPEARPNLYLLGFLVRQVVVPKPGEVTFENQVAGYFVFDVPGPRKPSLKLLFHHVPSFVFGRDVKGEFRVANDGTISTLLRGQVRVDSRFGGENITVVQAGGLKSHLLPAGVSRTVPYDWHASGLFSVARPQLDLGYPTGGPKMGALTASGPTVIVIPPETAIGAGAVVLVATFFAVRRVRRRRARRRLAVAAEA